MRSDNSGRKRSEASSQFLYGRITLASDLLPLELPLLDDHAREEADVVIDVSRSALRSSEEEFVHIWGDENHGATLALFLESDGFVLEFPGVAEFSIDSKGTRVVGHLNSQASEETFRHLLLDQVLPRVLALRGELVMHAATVNFRDGAVCFVGDSGEGKSTLAASFHDSGIPLKSDDGVVLDCRAAAVEATPLYPSLRLWPSALRGLYKTPPDTAPMAHYSIKRRVLIDRAAGATPTSLPLLAIYDLTCAEDSSAGGEETIVASRLSPRDACMTIVRNAFQLDVTDRSQVRRVLNDASEIAKRVPVFSLRYPREFSQLRHVQALIRRQHDS